MDAYQDLSLGRLVADQGSGAVVLGNDRGCGGAECPGRVLVSCWFSVLSAYTERAGWDGVTGVIRARGCNSCGVERDSLKLFE